MDEWSACRRDLYLTTHNTQHSEQTDIRAHVGIRDHDLSRRAAAELRLRPRGHWDRPYQFKRENLKKKSYHLKNLRANGVCVFVWAR